MPFNHDTQYNKGENELAVVAIAKRNESVKTVMRKKRVYV